MTRSFGRRYAPDDRDQRYPFRLLLDPHRAQYFPRGLPPGSRYYVPGPVLDQLDTGTCVAHGVTSRIESAPIMQHLPVTPYDLYRQIVTLDEWPENDREATGPDEALQSGTSVRAGIKAVQQLGYVQSYLWAQSVEDIRAWHLAGFGGVILGLNWHDGMMEPDRYGFIHATGAPVGGHCIVSTGWNDAAKFEGRRIPAIRLQQSWGRSWGDEGRCWLSASDLGLLFAARGEAAAVTETRVKPK